jgi:hypothetical protein
MNQENFDYLKNQVKFTGFGDTLEYQLKDNMEKGLDKFQLNYTVDYGKDKVDATLNFRQSDKGMYYFNNYELSLQKDGVDPAHTMKQTFYVNAPQAIIPQNGQIKDGEVQKEWVNSNITLREGYNLMDGRSVHKEFVSKEKEKFASWTTLDLKNTDEKGNFLMKRKSDFDLNGKLSEYPIKELATPESRQQLVESLQKGNRQTVTFLHNGQEEKRSIEANPQYKGIKVFDGVTRVVANESKNNDQRENHSAENTIKNGQKNEVNEQGANKRKSKHQGL